MGHIRKVVEYIRTADFIPLVKDQPAIWDIHSKEYSNRNQRKEAWESIYVQFFEDFHERSPEEQTEIAICFQTKWKSLRNCFTRELKRRKEDPSGGRRPYMYFEDLRFLESAQKHVYYSTSDGATDNNGDASPISQNKAKRVRLQNHDDKSPEVFHYEPEGLSDDSVDSLTNQDDSSNTDKDGDRLFILSLVPEFKRIPENRRLLAKSEILNVILKAQGFV